MRADHLPPLQNFYIDYINQHLLIQLDNTIFTWSNPVANFSTSTAGRRSPSLAGWIGWLGISIFLCDTILSVSTGWIGCWASCRSSSIDRPPCCAICLVDRVCFWHFFSFPVYRSVLSFTNSEVLESAIQFLIIWSSIDFDGVGGLYNCFFRSSLSIEVCFSSWIAVLDVFDINWFDLLLDWLDDDKDIQSDILSLENIFWILSSIISETAKLFWIIFD